MSVTGKQLTATVLKEVLTDALIFRDGVTSLDTNTTTGFYDVFNVPDAPYGSNPFGTLIVLNSLRTIVQIYIPDSVRQYQGIPQGMFVRTRVNRSWGAWRSWKLTHA